MEGNGQLGKDAAAGSAFVWPGRVLTFEDVRSRLNGQRELILSPRTVVTPLAADQLRAQGIKVMRQAPTPTSTKHGLAAAGWGYALDRPDALVRGVIQALERDGLSMKELSAPASASPALWAKALAECVARGECRGGVAFCQDPGLVACVANKTAGLRAVAVANVAQAARAVASLGPNLVAIEMPGRTFFELRQILRTVCTPESHTCPDGTACVLQELEGHAHR